METSYLGNAGVFLVSTLFGLYILAVMLRMLLAWVRADFYNPVSQFLVTITNPALIPLRRVIPALGRLDTAALVLLAGLETAKLLLIGVILGNPFSVTSLLILAAADLLSTLLNIYTFSIIIQVILSWVAPHTYHPVASVLYQLNEPVLGPVRRIIPPLSGLDLSPLVVIIGIQVAKMLVVAPMTDIGWTTSLG